MAEDYRGFVGAVVSAFRRSDSHVFRAYVVTSVLVGVFVALVLALGVVAWLATPAPIGQRALLGVIAISVLVPLFAPVLIVARRHRHGTGNRRADAVLGLAGFGFVLAGYLALLVSDPNAHEVTGPLAPAIAAVDALPRRYWIVPPLLSAASIWLAVRFTRSAAADDGGSDGPPDPAAPEAEDEAGDPDREPAEG